ncbi:MULTISPECIES: GntR family transcriptional regulator [Micromonospora]|uniref:GntR family transcriptional regulator n=1 Tax=Micromonospora TaxID=1873 RepID=UPI00098D3849|nr:MULTISPECIES: winged helix-turn-helix domain-containing protein [unclassified Micromonospora]MDI5937413.1 winged helix-turn-helix domain-containing protein [Micromonospora sp. DH15]OON31184.1 GntR family transcriptional regulator [Micromonospora sp. Rc5]
MPYEQAEYRRIADGIAGQIKSGELKAHDNLPSTAELAEKNHVSLATVNRAFGLLHDRFLVYGKQSKGVFVAEAE